VQSLYSKKNLSQIWQVNFVFLFKKNKISIINKIIKKIGINMSYKYYKIKNESCHRSTNEEATKSQVISLAFDYKCLGVKEMDLDESEVDKLLGDKAFVTGELGADLVEVNSKDQSDYFLYFEQIEDTEIFENILKDNNVSFEKFENLKQLDWNESWKESYTPIVIDNLLTIYPSWTEISKSNTSKYIKIYPGMGFGTGTHETTYLCLQTLILLREKITFDNSTNCLDLGCGSGILGIAIEQLYGMDTIYCDVDVDALTNTKQNLQLNNISNNKLYLRNVLPKLTYNLIFANIILSELENEKKFIFDSLKNDGFVILSGVLNNQVNELKSIFKDFKLVSIMSKNDWSCLVYSK